MISHAFGSATFPFPFGSLGGGGEFETVNTHYANSALVFDVRTNSWTDFDFGSENIGSANGDGNTHAIGLWTFGAQGLHLFSDEQDNTQASDTFLVSATENEIETELLFNWAAPDASAFSEWTMLHIQFERRSHIGTIESPTVITVSFVYDSDETEAQTITFDAATYYARINIPIEARASTRLGVRLIHEEPNETIGIEGIALEYTPGSSEVRT